MLAWNLYTPCVFNLEFWIEMLSLDSEVSTISDFKFKFSSSWLIANSEFKFEIETNFANN